MEILIKNFSFGYSSKKILNNISMKISSGSVLLILGRNGAGKTTLVKGILNKLNIGRNNIFINNTDVVDFKHWDKVSYVPQDLNISGFPINVNEFLIAFNRNHNENDVNKILKKLNIEKLKYKNLNKLSGGELRRVFIARGLINEISLLIMDEPMNAIDEASFIDIKNLIKEISSMGITTLIITHDFKELKKVASHVVEIDSGVNFYGSCEEYERR